MAEHNDVFAWSHKEVDQLLVARFIREVHYPKWLSNVVLVKKFNSKWWMCIDFTKFNKAFPKHSFPLPQIDFDCRFNGRL